MFFICRLEDGAGISVRYPAGRDFEDSLEAFEDLCLEFCTGAGIDMEGQAAAQRAVEAAAARAGDEGRGESAPAAGGEAPCVREWPTTGFVTAAEIVSWWNLGQSSFRNRVRSGEFSAPADLPDRPENAAKVWDAAVIGRELEAAGYVRRGVRR